MLAIKECLIREGVLNLVGGVGDSNNNNNSNQNYLNNCNMADRNMEYISSELDKLGYQNTVVDIDILGSNSGSNNLSSASATAKSSCQKLPNTKATTTTATKQKQSTPKSSKAPRYQGQHPHFHHHTAPAYYTDVNLRIHTPDAADVAALNENYQSVYSTPSKLVKAHHFPKSATATVAPPPIGARTSPLCVPSKPVGSNASSRTAFFRGGSAGKERPSLERYKKSSPTFGSPTKGEFFIATGCASAAYAPGTHVVAASGKANAVDVEPPHPHNHRSSITTPPTPVSSSSRSRNANRFAGRKRAVRVRSESRPISALYEIICKEKGLDIGTTTTNDEDSSPTNSYHEDRNDQTYEHYYPRQQRKQRSPLSQQQKRHSFSAMSRSPSLAAGDTGSRELTKRPSKARVNATHVRKKKDSVKAAIIATNDLSDGDEDNSKPHLLKPSPKATNINFRPAACLKSGSLPPNLANNEVTESLDMQSSCFELTPNDISIQTQNPHLRHKNSANNGSIANLFQRVRSRPQSEVTVLNGIIPFTKLYVEPVNFHLSNIPQAVAGRPSKLERGQRSAQPRKLHDENRRLTDGAIGMAPINHSDESADENKWQSTKAKRFITRSNNTPSRGRNSANPSPAKRSDSSPSPVNHVPPNSSYSHLTELSTVNLCTNGNSPSKTDMTNSAPGASPATEAAHTIDSISTSTIPESQCSIGAALEISNSDDAVITDKKREEDQLQRYSMPTSPHHLLQSPKYQNTRRHSSSSDNQKSPVTFDAENKHASSTLEAHRSSTDSVNVKKLVPSLSVSVKQNLSELHFNGGTPEQQRKGVTQTSPNAECTVKILKSSMSITSDSLEQKNVINKERHRMPSPRPRSSTMSSNEPKVAGSNAISELSPIAKLSTPDLSPRRTQDRDKSSKRKSNLNRSLNDEATQDNDESAALRRRRRRELGMALQLIPSDDPALRELIAQQKPNALGVQANNKLFVSPPSSPRTDLAFHMENARRGLDRVNSSASASASERKRAQTASPASAAARVSKETKAPHPARVSRRSDTLPLAEGRKQRSKDVNRKLNERTKSDLAEIMKIAEMANASITKLSSDLAVTSEKLDSKLPLNELPATLARDEPKAIETLAESVQRITASHERELMPSSAVAEREPSPAKRATFTQEEHTYYEPEVREVQFQEGQFNAGSLLRQRMLKARSVERDAGHEPPKLSPILRRKSTDDPSTITSPVMSATAVTAATAASAQNHIVSILKKKDHIAGESSSASSNASPVTFSANVVDTPASKQKRAGILKKRSSLDESRYYSRSHSPDERSILIKSARRNSLEETAAASQQQQHGILKQSSYDSSKSDGCPSATEPHPHGILKKKDSTSTPSDGGGSHAPKHVSISQAVILAAAELCRESGDNASIEHDDSAYTPSNEEYEIRPILKLESASSDDAMRPPKPILKKKSSGDSDEHEIRPILKTSRKSSREEFDLSGVQSDDCGVRHQSEPTMRPILKTDSPSKRRSLGGEEKDPPSRSSSPSVLKRRTRSLERQDAAPVVDLAEALNAIATSQATPVEFVSAPPVTTTTSTSISVAERIKSMEKFLNTHTSPANANVSGGAAAADVCGASISLIETSSTTSTSPQSGAVPKILKPSAIKRDMYRDRYKTQPVTNEEINFFKTTVSPFDITRTSAFKPAKSLDALNYVAFANLQSQKPPDAGSANNATTYTLARSLTQPLQKSYAANNTTFAQVIPPSSQRPQQPSTSHAPATTAAIANNSWNAAAPEEDISICEQSAISVGSDSERIFEMSGIDSDANTAATVQDNRNDISATGDPDAASSGGGVGVARKNSVRARANMFQQLQERTKAAVVLSREERTSPRRAPRRISPSPATARDSEEPKTPQNPVINSDEEIEPSSLPLSERLRFFSSLSESANRSYASSYTRSPPYSSIERCASANSYASSYVASTPRSSQSSNTSASSASVTPTPMECGPLSIHELEPLPATDAIDNGAAHESSAFLKLSKSSSHTQLTARSLDSAALPTGTTALTPTTRRIKLKTIGKLMLPQTFLNSDSNNNAETSDEGHDETPPLAPPKPPPKIGKIKSPFIENCQLQQQQQRQDAVSPKCMKLDHKSMPYNALASLENTEEDNSTAPRKTTQQLHSNGSATQISRGGEDANADSGKENYCEQAPEQPTSAVVEMRKKFTRIMSTASVTFGAMSALSRQNSTATGQSPQRNTLSGESSTSISNGHNSLSSGAFNNGHRTATRSSTLIDDKYAKYFGIAPNTAATGTNGTTKAASTATATAAKGTLSSAVAKRNLQNMPDVCQVTPKLRCAGTSEERNDSGDVFASLNGHDDAEHTPPAPFIAAINTNVRLQASTPLCYTTSPGAANFHVTATGGPVATSKRREMAKRNRAMTTIVNTTPATAATGTAQQQRDTSTTGVCSRTNQRTLRTRSHTITHSVQFGQQAPEVQKFEDILVTKEEFQRASKEFDRIFMGV